MCLKSKKNIRTLSEYTDEEKCLKFDDLYKMAEKHLALAEDPECIASETDDEHYMFEAIMEMLSSKDGPSIWEYYNSICE